jgi:hypothetical protein
MNLVAEEAQRQETGSMDDVGDIVLPLKKKHG